MKKSNALLIVILVSALFYFTSNSIIEQIVLKINITILFVGYFIVRQLEENKNNES